MTARLRHMAEFMRSMYPAFSRRATQVCILSSALEKIALGTADAPTIARAALAAANPFGWNERSARMVMEPHLSICSSQDDTMTAYPHCDCGALPKDPDAASS